MQRVGWVKKDERPNEPGKSPATHTHADRRTTVNDTKCGQIGKDGTNFFGGAGKYKTRRADEHRKSRSHCRTERLNCTKPVLGSQLFQNPRCKSVMPAQQGAPHGTLPPCGVHTFPPCRRHTVTRMRKEDGFPKGEEPWVPHPLAFVPLKRGISSPPDGSGNETARVRRQPLWEKRFRRFS